MYKRIGLLFICLFALIGSLAACQKEKEAEDTAEEAAEQFLTYIAEGKYEDAYEITDDKMKDLIAASDLEDVWTALEQTAGEHVSLKFDKKEEDDEYEIVYIISTFAKEDITFMVTVNEELEIIGFFVV